MQGHGAGGRDVQRIEVARHTDRDGPTPVDSGLGQSRPFGSQQDRRTPCGSNLIQRDLRSRREGQNLYPAPCRRVTMSAPLNPVTVGMRITAPTETRMDLR